MTTAPGESGPPAHRRPLDRVGVAIAVVATAVGVWLGFAGPSASPVLPSPVTAPAAPGLP